jgi:hypothetical protein
MLHRIHRILRKSSCRRSEGQMCGVKVSVLVLLTHVIHMSWCVWWDTIAQWFLDCYTILNNCHYSALLAFMSESFLYTGVAGTCYLYKGGTQFESDMCSACPDTFSPTCWGSFWYVHTLNRQLFPFRSLLILFMHTSHCIQCCTVSAFETKFVSRNPLGLELNSWSDLQKTRI